MSTTTALKIGTHVLVPWGLNEPREGVIVETWGDPKSPSHIRVELISGDGDDTEVTRILLDPRVVKPAA